MFPANRSGFHDNFGYDSLPQYQWFTISPLKKKNNPEPFDARQPSLSSTFTRFFKTRGFLGSDQIGLGGIVGNAKVGLNLILGPQKKTKILSPGVSGT